MWGTHVQIQDGLEADVFTSGERTLKRTSQAWIVCSSLI